MKIYISYFYKIRFFPTNYIPISTASSDPTWFHDGKGKNYVFKDKRGVYNGIRNEQLHPDDSCSGLCGGNANCDHSPDHCAFLQAYYKQLSNIDFPTFVSDLETMLQRTGEENPVPVLIVHEAPTNPCSERVALFKWLRDNNIECEEYN